MKKTIARKPNRTIELLDQVTGAGATVVNNPLFTPGGAGGSNPLHDSASAATNPLYTPL